MGCRKAKWFNARHFLEDQTRSPPEKRATHEDQTIVKEDAVPGVEKKGRERGRVGHTNSKGLSKQSLVV